jgi:radical SAM-linked protein
VQRVRVRYAKRGRLRFTSHRDFARAFERALRRAAVPVAYSAGFTPHPKVSYAGAAPTGTASEAEYLELGLAERCDPEALRASLDAALPDGIDVLLVVEPEPGAPSLADQLEASEWRIELAGVTASEARSAVEAFLGQVSVVVERRTKDGTREVDARAVVLTADVAEEADGTGNAEPCATLNLVVRHSTPAVRPDDVLTALRRTAALSTPVTPMVTRLAQGRIDATSTRGATRVLDPLGLQPQVRQ